MHTSIRLHCAPQADFPVLSAIFRRSPFLDSFLFADHPGTGCGLLVTRAFVGINLATSLPNYLTSQSNCAHPCRL